MRCYNCGNEIKKGQMFCPSCGKEVQLVSPQTVLEDDFLDDFFEDEKNPEKKEGKRPGKNRWEDGSAINKKDQRKLVIVSLCVMVFVVGVAVALWFYLQYNTHQHSYSYQMETGDKALSEGDKDKAISCYERAVELNGSDMTPRIKLGNVYLDIRDYDSAQITFQEAINRDASNVEAYKGLLKVYQAQKLYDKITEVSSSIKDPTVIEALSDYLVEAPEFDKEEGKYDDAITVKLKSADGDTIYYTTDGQDPVKYGSKYKEPFEFKEDGTYKVSAVCVNKQGVYSETITKEYEVVVAAPDIPKVSPSGGNFGALTYVSVEVPENCTAYYTWDGTKPSVASKRYTAPFSIPSGTNVLSVILIDSRTGKSSEIYRSSYVFYD